MSFDPKKVKIARQLVFATLKLEVGKEVFVTVREKMRKGREEEPKPGELARKPATILPVNVLFAGKDNPLNEQDAVCVAPKLLEGYLRENYPDDTYVGKSFRILKGEKKKGKVNDYSAFDVAEIEA